MQHRVVVITHHRIGGDVDGEYAGNFQQTFLDPLPSVFKASAALAVLTAQKRATHTARYAVVLGGGV
jgi:hypothetical protein